MGMSGTPLQGRSQDISKGGHPVSNIIVMAFSPRNIVGCFLKKRLTKGGHGHPRTPLATPLGFMIVIVKYDLHGT